MADNKQVMQQFAAWARSHGIAKPSTKAELQVLFDQFISEHAEAADAVDEVLGGGVTHSVSEQTHLVNDGSTVQIVDPAPSGIFENDWDRLLRDRTHASVGPNGEILDDFDTEFQLMGVTAAAQAAVAPPSNTNPATAVNALLGGQASADSRKDPVEVVRWVGNDSEATSMIVAAGPVTAPKAFNSTTSSFRTFCVVQFGTRGYLYTVEVDIGPGVQFTVGGSFISVAIGCETDTPNLFTSQPLSATVSFGDSDRFAPLTRTKYVDSTGPVTVTVPAFAKGFMLIVSNPAAAIAVTVNTTQTATIQAFTQAAGVVPVDFYALSPDAAVISITGAGGGTSVRCVFELGL